MLPPTSGTETNIKLPFSFILFSTVALIISQIILLLNSDSLFQGIYRIPPIWSFAHLFILGWAVCVCMGAMYQLIPVAFLVKIWNETFGFLQLAITVIGISWFSYALYFSPGTALIPGAIMFVGILMFLFQMGMTLRKQKNPNSLTLFVGTSLICLLLTILIGITLIICIAKGFSPTFYQPIFYSHMFLGIAGWFTLLIFGFSYKMGPMFALSHGFGMGLAKYVYGFYVSGLVVGIISFFIDSKPLFTLSLNLLLIGFSFFTKHMADILKKRVKKKLDRPFQFALLAIIFGEFIHIAAFLAALFNQFGKFVGPLIILYFILWIAFSIFGYLYKIVPFLWWTHRYSQKIGKENVPALKDLMNEKLALPLFIGFILGVFLIGFGLIVKWNYLFTGGIWVFTFCSLIFSLAIVNVLRK